MDENVREEVSTAAASLFVLIIIMFVASDKGLALIGLLITYFGFQIATSLWRIEHKLTVRTTPRRRAQKTVKKRKQTAKTKKKRR